VFTEGVRVLESSLGAPAAGAVLHLLGNPRILEALARYRMFEPATTNLTADLAAGARAGVSTADDQEEWTQRMKVQIRMRQGLATKAWQSGDRPLALRSVNKSLTEMQRQMSRLSHELDEMATCAAALAPPEEQGEEAMDGQLRPDHVDDGRHSPSTSSDSAAESGADENFELYTVRPFGAEARAQKKPQKKADPLGMAQHVLHLTDPGDDPANKTAFRRGWVEPETDVYTEVQRASADLIGTSQAHASHGAQKRWGLLRECFHSQQRTEKW
jgi:hypothetical protein